MGLGSGHLEIFVFRPSDKNNKSDIIGLVRPAGGTQISLKLINYDVKWKKRFSLICSVYKLVTYSNHKNIQEQNRRPIFFENLIFRGSLYEHVLPGSLI